MASHRVMYYGLREAFPNIRIISEEHEQPDSQAVATCHEIPIKLS